MNGSGRLSEDQLIARYFAPFAGEGAFGLRDDAARITPRDGHEIVVTVDAIVSGIHFFPDDPASSVGRKALAVNVSDLAAKGARPLGFVLSLALPDDWRPAWLEEFAEGLHQAAMSFGCPLLGGDTVRANGPFWASVTAFGETPKGTMVHRFNAAAGDAVCVTGTIGDAALGLSLRKDPLSAWAQEMTLEKRVHLTDRYLHPQPRIALADVVRRHARAAMDISDGLAGDLAKMAKASGLTAEVDLASIPLSAAARLALEADPSRIDTIVTGGDDYELLCAVAPENLDEFSAEAAAAGVSAISIGRFCKGDSLPLFSDATGQKRYQVGSYTHF
jgi:thiamine-monophosphate kinase